MNKKANLFVNTMIGIFVIVMGFIIYDEFSPTMQDASETFKQSTSDSPMSDFFGAQGAIFLVVIGAIIYIIIKGIFPSTTGG